MPAEDLQYQPRPDVGEIFSDQIEAQRLSEVARTHFETAVLAGQDKPYSPRFETVVNEWNPTSNDMDERRIPLNTPTGLKTAELFAPTNPEGSKGALMYVTYPDGDTSKPPMITVETRIPVSREVSWGGSALAGVVVDGRRRQDFIPDGKNGFVTRVGDFSLGGGNYRVMGKLEQGQATTEEIKTLSTLLSAARPIGEIQ